QRRADRRPRRVDPSDQQQRDGAADVIAAEPLAAHLGVHQEVDEIAIFGLELALLDLLPQVEVERVLVLHVVIGTGRFEDAVDEPAELVAVLLGESEHLGDDADRGWSKSVAQSVTGGRSGMTAAYGERVETIVAALAAQQAELTSLLDDEAWVRPSRCEGWSVADVVLHLAQTNEMAQSSLDGTFGQWARGFPTDARDVDDGADRLVVRERG